jgi:lactate dehydrogenase-like 2-hydroxyacid dehydrogenase
MTRPRLLVTRRLTDAVEARVARDYEALTSTSDVVLGADEILKHADGKDGLLITITDRLDAQAIAALPASIRIIATVSVGIDHIDVKAAAARGIMVTNTPDVLTDATAEIAILLMLGAARGANAGMSAIRENTWGVWSANGMLGTEITGTRLGILGMGRIGQAVAKRARAFDMHIHYHNRNRLPPEQEQGATWHSSADSLFSVSDVLSLHCASTSETKRMVNSPRLALLPRGAIVVNTARGDIVDDGALIDAVRSGHVSAIGLDVFNNEPNLDPRYRTLGSAFLLPHVGSANQ